MDRNVIITRQDAKEEPISASIGEAFIGRALIPNCKDRRIRDNHGLIRLSSDGKHVVLTPLKRMYFIPRKEVKRQVLEKGSAVTLRSGDRFSFLPQRFCFRINVAGTTADKPTKRKCSNTLINQNISGGRLNKDDDDDNELPGATKKIKRNSDEELADKEGRKASLSDLSDMEEEPIDQHREIRYRRPNTANIQNLEPLDDETEDPTPKTRRRKAKSNSSSEEDYSDPEDGDYDER